MQNLAHPNVLKILGAGRNTLLENGKPTGEVHFTVTELAEYGELFNLIQDAGGLNPVYSRLFFTELVSAVEFIHAKGIVHRDLKLENCFLN